MEGNDIYHSRVVLCVYWVDLSEEAFRVRHVSDVAERFVSTSLVKKQGQHLLSLSKPKWSKCCHLSPDNLKDLKVCIRRNYGVLVRSTLVHTMLLLTTA
jgi:hypothetical protein